MRPSLLLLLAMSPLLTLAGCQQDFDSQYAETEKKVKAVEAKIDAEMAKEAKREPGTNVKSH
jgi:hypothetical protein